MLKEPSGQPGPLFIYFYCKIQNQSLHLHKVAMQIFVACPPLDILILTE